jgi:hypothetical protein
MNSLTLTGDVGFEIGRLAFVLPANDGAKQLTVLVAVEDLADLGRTNHDRHVVERTLRANWRTVEQAAQRAYETQGANERGEVLARLF